MYWKIELQQKKKKNKKEKKKEEVTQQYHINCQQLEFYY